MDTDMARTRSNVAAPPEQHPQTIQDFIGELERQEISALTRESYYYDLVNFASWYTSTNGEPFSPASIAPTDVRDYKAHLQTVEKRAPATINRRLAALRKFFQWAKAEGTVRELPTEPVKGIKRDPLSPKALDKRELDRLIREAFKDGSKRNLAILHTLKGTGLRVAELCDLELSDVQISERKGQLVVRSGKRSRHRIVPLNADVRRALSDYLAVRPKAADSHLFIGQRGEGLKEQAVQNVVSKYARLAGLEKVSPHTLRHSFATQSLRAGVDLVSVAKLLGHQRLETTAIYTQPSQRDLEQAVEKLVDDQ
jgi:site-specific recombinase XerD